MICQFKPDTTLTFVNHAYASMFGSEPEKLIGRRFLDFIPRKEHELIRIFLAGFDVNNPKLTYRHSVELPDGSTGWQEWTDYAFFDDDKNISGFQSVGRDITREVLLIKALEKSEEKERRLIARDLHDHIGQMLAYIKIRIESGMTNVEGNDNNVFNEEILDLVIDSMQELRKVSRRIIAGFVKDEPLVDTVTNLVESFEKIAKIKVSLNMVNVPQNLTPEAKNNLYRVIQEAITNILKHSGASTVSIDFYSDNESINLIILDDGKGANVNSPKIKKGFVTMRHRVEVMHGTISFESDPGYFFKIAIKLPKKRLLQENHKLS